VYDALTLDIGSFFRGVGRTASWRRCARLRSCSWRHCPCSTTPWSPAHGAFIGRGVHRSEASDGTAAPHREITQRWDLMALRLSGFEKPTSDPDPSHPPGSSACHRSFVKRLTLIWLPSNLRSADYTLLGSRRAAFSNFTWQQIAGLLHQETRCVLFRRNLRKAPTLVSSHGCTAFI